MEEHINLKKLVVNENKTIIWSNTHGSKLAEYAHIILPLATFFEATYKYINAEGFQQKTVKILPDANMIISRSKLLLLVFGLNDNKTSLINLIGLNPFNSRKNKFIVGDRVDSTLLTNYPLKSNLEDFYLSNTFTKASAIMGQCSQTNRKISTNFFNF